jgi:hypothetical protein
MNFGVSGYGIDQILLYMEDTVLPYRPEVVVMGFVRDDMRRIIWRFRHHSKPLLVQRDNQLVVTNVPVPDNETILAREKYRLRSWDILNVIWDRIRWRLGHFEADMLKLGDLIMARLLAEIDTIGAQVVLVYLPHSEGLYLTYDQFYSIEEQYFDRLC